MNEQLQDPSHGRIPLDGRVHPLQLNRRQRRWLPALYSCFLALLCAGVVPLAQASAGNNNIKIVAYYGAGNLSKSEYARDTVILFNPTQAAITMNKWSLQTGGTTGVFSTIYPLPTVTIPAGGFYAVAASGIAYISSAGCSSSHCNLNYPYDVQVTTLGKTPTDADNNLSSTATVIALANNQTAISGTCSTTASNLVDIVGVGAADGTSPVTCFAGSNYATYTPATTNGAATNINGIVYAYATVRKNKCVDTFNNSSDFFLGFIDFYNSSSAPQPCPTGTQMVVTGTATPTNPGVTESVTIKATVTPATSPASTGLRVTADLSNLGLSAASQLYDDGTHGDAVANDNNFTLATTVGAGNIGAVPGVFLTATDTQGNNAKNVVAVSIAAGTFSMTTPSTAKTVDAGGVLTFPITITGQHGYGGILAITCTGTPNTNTLGVPIKTQCVATPPEVSIGTNGTATFSLAIATGTTFSAGIASRSLVAGLAGLLSIGILSVGIFRRKHLPAALLLAFVSVLVLQTTACATASGLGNTSADPGVYTYTVTAADSKVATVNNTLSLTVTVK